MNRCMAWLFRWDVFLGNRVMPKFNFLQQKNTSLLANSFALSMVLLYLSSNEATVETMEKND